MQEGHTDNFMKESGVGASSGNVIFRRCAYAVAIMHSNDPHDPCDDHPSEDDLSGLRATARRLIDAISAEPVPERLRVLAIELGKALDRQKEKDATQGNPADPR